jgi:hypothetical protein
MATFQGIPGFGFITSSSGTASGQVQGLPFTRLKGVGLVGTIADSVSNFPPGITGPGPIPPAGGFVCIQSTAAINNQIVSTSSGGLQNASLVYIPVTTGGLNGGVAPAYTGCGAPLIWNDNTATLSIWSTSRAAWMTQVVGTSFSAGNTTFTTS